MGHYEAQVGKVLRVLCEGEGKLKNGVLGEVSLDGDNIVLMGRTEQGMVVDFIGNKSLIGRFVEVKITEAANWALAGILA